MTTIQKKTPTPGLNVWCKRCCIRIAPNEERTESRGALYHIRCGPKPGKSQSGRA